MDDACHAQGRGGIVSAVAVIAVLVVISAIWVGIDASSLGLRRGKGFLDMGPAGWMFSVLLLWIVAFPAYLVKRSRIKRGES
jgi:hypothetical protein